MNSGRTGLWLGLGILAVGPVAALGPLFDFLPAAWAAGIAWLALVAGAAVLGAGQSRAGARQRQEAEAARRLAAGDYAAAFPQGADDRSAALAAMLAHFKHELGLARGIVKSMVTPFAVTDKEEVFIAGNPALVDMVQQSGRPEEHYGQNVAMFFYGDTRPTVLGVAMRERKAISKEVEFTGRKGRKLNIHIDASPLYDLTGDLMGALCVYTDLTELRHNEARILEQSNRIASAVKEIEGISKDLLETADGLSREVGQASQTTCSQLDHTLSAAKSMDEINTAALEIARSASQASSQAEQAQAKAKEGASVVEKAVEAIAETNQLAAELKTNLDRLGQQAEGIGAIMNVITDIADQTNLLALNAAIEAARAGDAGRGFAVVADEVRKLAEKTMNATKEVGEAIAAIQRDTRLNVAGMDRAAAAVSRTSDLAGSSGEALREIVRLVALTSDQIQAIAAASEEQSASTEGISDVMGQVRASCDETTEGMSQAGKAVERLTTLAGHLRETVRKTLE